MAEYIKREDALRRTVFVHGRWDDTYLSATQLGAIPAADVAPVVHGRWVRHEADGAIFASYECSVCSAYPTGSIRSHYCPNCGAKMDGGAGE